MGKNITLQSKSMYSIVIKKVIVHLQSLSLYMNIKNKTSRENFGSIIVPIKLNIKIIGHIYA